MSDKFNQAAKEYKQITWLPVKQLSVVWVGAQRPLNDNHASFIADNFDPEKFGVLSVTKPNGKGIYHVIDGHHRKVAVEKMWGMDEKVPCQIFDADDPKRAAELFDGLNSGRRKVHPIELFNVRLTAGAETETAIDRIVRKCGYSVGFRSPKSVSCVAALEKVYLTYGPAILQGTLDTIQKIWGYDQVANESHFVKGLAMLLSEYRTLDHAKLVAAVGAKYTPGRLLGAAKATRELHGGTAGEAMRDLLLNCYNSGARKKAKLVPQPKAEKVAG